MLHISTLLCCGNSYNCSMMVQGCTQWMWEKCIYFLFFELVWVGLLALGLGNHWINSFTVIKFLPFLGLHRMPIWSFISIDTSLYGMTYLLRSHRLECTSKVIIFGMPPIFTLTTLPTFVYLAVSICGARLKYKVTCPSSCLFSDWTPRVLPKSKLYEKWLCKFRVSLLEKKKKVGFT